MIDHPNHPDTVDLVAMYDRLVVVIAWTLGARHLIRDSEQYADGWVGLLKGLACHDPSRGGPLSKHLAFRVRSAILDGLRARRRTIDRHLAHDPIALLLAPGRPEPDPDASIDVAAILARLDGRSARITWDVVGLGIPGAVAGRVVRPPLSERQTQRIARRSIEALSRG